MRLLINNLYIYSSCVVHYPLTRRDQCIKQQNSQNLKTHFKVISLDTKRVTLGPLSKYFVKDVNKEYTKWYRYIVGYINLHFVFDYLVYTVRCDVVVGKHQLKHTTSSIVIWWLRHVVVTNISKEDIASMFRV